MAPPFERPLGRSVVFVVVFIIIAGGFRVVVGHLVVLAGVVG